MMRLQLTDSPQLVSNGVMLCYIVLIYSSDIYGGACSVGLTAKGLSPTEGRQDSKLDRLCIQRGGRVPKQCIQAEERRGGRE